MHYRLLLLFVVFIHFTTMAYCHIGGLSQKYNNGEVAQNEPIGLDHYTVESYQTQSEGSVTDIEGNTYRTAIIGKQVWMVENMRTTRFNDGTPIPLVTDDTVWSLLNTPAYTWYDNDSVKYGIAYGALYNWFAVNTGKLCPTGWRVPTDADWTTLTDYLGGARVAGGKLKTTGTMQWRNPNLGATNEVGFYALPAGTRYGHGAFNYLSNYGLWWTATQYDTYEAWFRDVSSYDAIISRNYDSKRDGLSVRCIKR